MVVEAKPTTRVCRLCQVEKPMEEFRVVGIWPKWWCKDCERARNRNWHREERARATQDAATTKLCRKCNTEKPLTDEHWHQAGGKFTSPCGACRRSYFREHYATNGRSDRGEHRPAFPQGRPRTRTGPDGEAPTKVCGRCNVAKPLDEENWYRRPDGTWMGPCRPCRMVYGRAYAKAYYHDEPIPPSIIPAKGRSTTRPRRSEPRARTVNPIVVKRQVAANAVEARADLRALFGIDRPTTRGECVDGPRPCPWVSCHHHLFLDVNKSTGSLKLNFPHLEVEELRETCALDAADRGGLTLEEVGELMNLTRERVRQIEVRALLDARRADGWDED